MTLTPAFLDELRARTLLSALIGRSVKLQKAGREFRACCPFHQEKSPSFYVNDDKGFYHCLSAETKVITRNGRRDIGSLSGTKAEVLSRNGRWIEATFDAFGTQRLWKIDLSRNGLRKSVWATEGHRWFVNGRKSEVLTTDLRRGHALQAALPVKRQRWDLDAEGVRHGVIFGDGTMYKGVYGTINLHGDKDAELARWFPDQHHHDHQRANGKPYLRIYGGRAFENMKRLPDISMPDDYLLGFLAGYLAADGHIAKDGTVMLNSANGETLEAVRDIALKIGIATYGRTTLMRNGFGISPSALHRIHFVPSTLDVSLFLLERQRARFSGHSKAFDRVRWVVRSVEESDRIEPVFCAQVPEEHAFALEDNILTGNCFGCSAHGDAIRFLTESKGLPFIDAVKELAAAANMEMPALDPRAREQAERAAGLHEVTARAAGWFAEQLDGISGGEARSYLARRGVSGETARAFGLGFAPDARGRLRSALAEIGDAPLIEAGLLISVDDKEPYDRFRGRLMIPIRDPRGRVIAFGGRIIGTGEPKYLNSPDTPLFDKGRTLYNLDRAAAACRSAGRIIVVEGYMDVIALAQAGIGEAVAPLGTALTEAQLERLWRLAEVPVLCFDGDAAGQKAAIRAAHRALPLIEPGRSLAFATLPPGQDPDDLVRASGRAAFDQVIERADPLVERLWSHERDAIPLTTPEARAGLRRRLDELVQSIADRDVRDQYHAEFRARFANLFARAAPASGWQPQRGARAGQGRWTPPPRPLSAATRSIGAGGVGGLEARISRAIFAGLLRHPDQILPHGEAIAQLVLAEIALARLRDALLGAAFAGEVLDPEVMDTILTKAGVGALAGELRRTNGLAFSFTRGDSDPERAKRDLGVAIGAMAARPELDAALAAATARFETTTDDGAFEEQQRLNAARSAADRALAELFQSSDDDA